MDSGRYKSAVSALVLSGGGAQAAYEVGVIKALLTGQSPATRYLPLDFSIVTGTSAGSVNAGLLLSAFEDGPEQALQYMETVWLEDIADGSSKCNNGVFRVRADPMSFAHPACFLSNPISPVTEWLQDSAFLTRELVKRSAGFLLSNQKLGKRVVDSIDLAALISNDVLWATLAKAINLERIRSSAKVLKVSCTNWHTGTVRLFSNREMKDDLGLKVLLASSAIPGIFPPVEIQGELYADGGVVMNTPLKPAIDCGADILHVIYTDPTLTRIPLPANSNTASTMYRALLMALCTIFKQDIELAAKTNLSVARLHGRTDDGFERGKRRRQITIHRYNPFKDHNVTWLSFQREGIRRLIDLGLKDGVEHDCVRSNCILPYPAGDASKTEDLTF
jgi:predicted acylesterase/phospholipase RssA